MVITYFIANIIISEVPRSLIMLFVINANSAYCILCPHVGIFVKNLF